ncbi:unnamed protein product [Bursaphelenchus okinawaensis]|uniref:Uncharacterized protein n=1 Tax=Bursaphelenchus okinawaensis TaxID=465554 RepID=A0A811K9E3_9BILA|nr:unnamed protein product [Bursaphelenchus okinawaensis]CAG9094687.1 unnamed protein product [Bursaphelenchus okinawaensis]
MNKAQVSETIEEEQKERREYVKNIGIEYRYGCYEEKKPDTCHVLGEYLEAIDLSFAKAYQIFKDNCEERKFPRSCFKYAMYTLAGKECEASLKNTIEPLTVSCEGKVPPGCRYLSLVYWNGEPDRKPDSKLAEHYMKKACDMEDAEACWLLSTWYINSDSMKIAVKGVKNPSSEVNRDKLGRLEKDMEKALKYAKLACDLNIPQSCLNAARILKIGDGVAKDLDAAKLYLDKAKAMNEMIKKGKNATGFTG